MNRRDPDRMQKRDESHDTADDRVQSSSTSNVDTPRSHSVAQSLSIAALRQIDVICRRFERAAPQQQRKIETFLDGTEGDQRALLLLELISLDAELRRERGEEVGDEQYERLWASIGRRPESVISGVYKGQHWQAMLPPPPEPELTNVPEAERYEFIKRIGQGGIGDVWRAFDLRSERVVAIKLLRGRHRGDAAAETRFRREAKLTGTLQHPGIPPIYDHGRLDDGTAFMSMRLVEGQTLAHLLRDRRPAKQDLMSLLGTFEQVARTIAYVHTEGVVHRDLKPQNVMVGRFGEVQVMDWGLAKQLTDATSKHPEAASRSRATTDPDAMSRDIQSENDESTESVVGRLSMGPADDSGLTRAGDIVGTPSCMPPEQARGDLHLVDARADVFGLGAILYEMLTGFGLGHGLDTSEVLEKLSQGDLQSSIEALHRTDHDAELIQLCEDCLQPSREDRPNDGGQVASRISAYLAGVAQRLQDAEIDRSAAVVRAAEDRKRRRIVAKLASLVAVVSCLGLAGVAWQWNKAIESSRNAVHARSLADARFQQAKQIVQEYLTEVADRDGVLARTPGTQTLRRSLLEKARHYYEQFLAEASHDPALRFDTADAYARLGEITQVLDPGGDDVFSLYRKATEIYQQLANDSRGEDWIRATEGLSDAHAAIGNAYLAASDWARADVAYTASKAVLAEAIEKHGRDQDKLSVAKMQHNIALTRANRGKKQDAAEHFLDAIQRAEPLLDSQGTDPESLFDIANIFSGTGVHFGFKMGDWKASLKYGQRAVELRSQLVELAPNRHRYENALAGSYNNVALALYQNGRPDEAYDTFLKAAEMRERLTQENPSIPEYARQLGNVYNNLGTFSAKRNGGKDSVLYYTKALKLKRRAFEDHPQVLEYGRDTIDLLLSIVRMEPHHERTTELIRDTIETYEQMLSRRPSSRGYAANLALFRSLSMTPAEPYASALQPLRSKVAIDNAPVHKHSTRPVDRLLTLTQRESIEHSDASVRHRAIRALMLLRAGDSEKAGQTVALIPDQDRDPLCWLVDSLVQSAKGNPDDASKSLSRATAKLDRQPYPEYELLVLRAEAEQALAK